MRRGRVGARRVQPAAAARCTPSSDWLSWNCIPAAIGEETTTFEDGSSNSIQAGQKRLFGRYTYKFNIASKVCAACKLIGSAQSSFIFLSAEVMGRAECVWICLFLHLQLQVQFDFVLLRFECKPARERQMSITLWRAVPRVYYCELYNQLLSRALCKTSFKFLVNENQRDLTLQMENNWRALIFCSLQHLVPDLFSALQQIELLSKPHWSRQNDSVWHRFVGILSYPIESQ